MFRAVLESIVSSSLLVQVVEGSPVNSTIGYLTVTDPDNENAIVQSHHCVVMDPDRQPFKVQRLPDRFLCRTIECTYYCLLLGN